MHVKSHKLVAMEKIGVTKKKSLWWMRTKQLSFTQQQDI